MPFDIDCHKTSLYFFDDSNPCGCEYFLTHTFFFRRSNLLLKGL